MGADRLKNIKDNATRGWNRAGERLLNPPQLSLFDVHPTFAPPSFRIMLKEETTVCAGDQYVLHAAEGRQVLTHGPRVIAECSDLPTGIVERLKTAGTICVEVIGVGKLSNSIEVAPK
jgi:hypothetical protein